MKLLKELYKIYSPSGGEKRLRRYIVSYVKRNIPEATYSIDRSGNLFITKGVSESYPCIVAHLDQVQEVHSKDFKAIETNDIIFGYSAKNRRQEGLGADDKNGIWIALKCLERCEVLKVALFVQEEVGCVGSSRANLDFFDDCRFVIGCDRKGHSDLITNISWTNLCSDEFIHDIDPMRFGYQERDGFITDVGELKGRGLAISCINLSCGYYEPHTDYEFTVKADILNCLNFVEHIIETCTKVYPHNDIGYLDFGESAYYGNMGLSEIEELNFLAQEILEEYPDYTAEELHDLYGYYFPTLDIKDFEEVIREFNKL